MRLPRKRKKQVKKEVQRRLASKMVMSALTTAQARAKMAIISAAPGYRITAPAEKALLAAQTMVETTQSIRRIMSEPPNSWKDFIVSRETQKPSS